MILNINEFRAAATYDFQRLTKFKVLVPIPPVLLNRSDLMNIDRTTLQFMCDSSYLSGIMLNTMPIHRMGYGMHERKPVGAMINDMLLTFYNDGQSNNLFFFQEWMSAITSYNMSNGIEAIDGAGKSVYEFAYKDDYVVPLQFRLYNQQGATNMILTMRDCFPIHVQDIQTSWSLGAEVMRISVVMAFTDWYRDDAQAATLHQPQLEPQSGQPLTVLGQAPFQETGVLANNPTLT